MSDYESVVEYVNDFLNNRVSVVRCKDCKHRPIDVGAYKPYEAPNGDLICPFICADDEHYNDMPPDDFFCAYGEVKDDQL